MLHTWLTSEAMLGHLPGNTVQWLVFTEARRPSLSPGIMSFSFPLCNTLLLRNAQVLYKEDVSPGTAIGKTPEMMRVKKTQDHISSVMAQGTRLHDILPPFGNLH